MFLQDLLLIMWPGWFWKDKSRNEIWYYFKRRVGKRSNR